MKPKIEKVTNYVSKIDKFIVSSYFPAQDIVKNISFFYETIARERIGFEVGMWRIKTLNNNYHAN